MSRMGWFLLSIVAVLVLTGCCCSFLGDGVPLKIADKIHTGQTQRETYHVEPDGTERVDVTVQFGGGTLDVQRGSSNLLSADFVYAFEGIIVSTHSLHLAKAVSHCPSNDTIHSPALFVASRL